MRRLLSSARAEFKQALRFLGPDGSPRPAPRRSAPKTRAIVGGAGSRSKVVSADLPSVLITEAVKRLLSAQKG